MQQRTMGSSRGPDWDDSFIDVEAQLEVKQRPSPWRRITESIDQQGLPISDHEPRDIGNRETARSWFTENWLHVIPLIVLSCFFVLCWFSYPVHLVIKDGSIVAIHRIPISGEFNETRRYLALLTSASSPETWNFQGFTRADVREPLNTYQSGFDDQQWKNIGLAHRVEISRGFNDNLVDPALLALAALPRASNFQYFTRTNETETLKANQGYFL